MPHPPYKIVTLWYRPPEVLLGQPRYTSAVDLWSLGCITAEMLHGCALFPGDSEIDQLHRIFRVCGTPSEASWPSVTQLPDYRDSFPVWPAQRWAELLPHAPPAAAAFIAALLCCRPDARLSADAALQHPFVATGAAL